MAQINSSYQEARIPFAKMTFTPDVPSTALAPNEYNAGVNVEADVRGIRSVAGDQEFLNAIPGTPTYVSSGFRQSGTFWFIVATTEGYWYAASDTVDWYNITPGGGPIAGYEQNTNITEAWNGTVPFFNDTVGAPMFLPDEPGAILTQYSNLVLPAAIGKIVYNDATTQQIFMGASTTGSDISGTTLTIGTLVEGVINADITPGQYIQGTGVLSGTQIVANLTFPNPDGSGSTWTINKDHTNPPGPGPIGPEAIVLAPYVTAPYVAGQQILIAGVNNFFNGTFVAQSSTTYSIIYYAVPGAGYPGYASGQTVSPAYTWNYNPQWKSVRANFLRLYNTPNVGSILVAGDLTATLLDGVTTVNFPVTVQWSQAFGLNQAPKTWQPTITNIANQLEVPLRGPAQDAFPSNGQFFLCSYWDTVVFSPINYSTTSAPILGVRLYNQGRGLLTSNAWANTDKLVYGVDARDVWVFDGNDFTGIGNQRVKNWFYDQLDPQYYDRVFVLTNTQKSQIEIYYPDSTATSGVPNKMLAYRYDLDCWNAPRQVTNATQGCEAPVYTYDGVNWVPNYSSRGIVYARGETDKKLVMKDIGYSFLTSNANPNGDITSTFRRDNIKLLKDYSGKLMVHRILPEVVNIGAVPFQVPGTDNLPIIPSPGNITITIEGSNSVASTPTSKIPVTIPIDANGNVNTRNPWAQIDQNAFRVNTIQIGDTSNAHVWMCSAATWQITQVEDDR